MPQKIYLVLPMFSKATYQKQHTKSQNNTTAIKSKQEDIVWFTGITTTHSKQQPTETEILPWSPYVLCPFTSFTNRWIPLVLFSSFPLEAIRRYDLKLFDVIWYIPITPVRHRINGLVISQCPKFCPVLFRAQLMILYLDITSTTRSSVNLKEI